MKSNLAFWMIVGTGVGASAGMLYDNLTPGLCFGVAAGIIATLFTSPDIYQKDKK